MALIRQLPNSMQWCFRIFAPLTQVRGVLAICTLVAQMLASAASHPALAGEWMVICSEDGPVLMQGDISGNDTTPCPECEECQACNPASAANAVLPGHSVSRFHLVRPVGPLLSAEVLSTNPAQFWPDNRDPPLANQINTSDRTHRLSCAATPNQGGAPWT